MARSTEAAVKQVIDTALTVAQITPHLNRASRVVTVAIVNKGATYGGDQLKDIETYLAAHFVAIMDPIITKEKLGQASREYLIPTGATGFATTPFGMTAMSLDTDGYLARCSEIKGAIRVEAYPSVTD